jgi:hypothetical protein
VDARAGHPHRAHQVVAPTAPVHAGAVPLSIRHQNQSAPTWLADDEVADLARQLEPLLAALPADLARQVETEFAAVGG